MWRLTQEVLWGLPGLKEGPGVVPQLGTWPLGRGPHVSWSSFYSRTMDKHWGGDTAGAVEGRRAEV